jgi:hypothetical protein
MASVVLRSVENERFLDTFCFRISKLRVRKWVVWRDGYLQGQIRDSDNLEEGGSDV